MPWKDKEKRKEYRQNNREKLKASRKRYRQNHKEEFREHYRQVRLKLKMKAFDVYGRVCVWCGEDDITSLTIDHIKNNGSKHLDKKGYRLQGSRIYTWLKAHNYPSDFQVLCFNCNHAKSFHNGVLPENRKNLCKPHQLLTEQLQLVFKNRARLNHLKRKIKTFNVYGGCKCSWCGETDVIILTIDHINNDGHLHLHENKSRKGYIRNNSIYKRMTGAALYRWLKKHNYPSDFQVLCFNCNCTKERNKGILLESRRNKYVYMAVVDYTKIFTEFLEVK